MSRLIRLKKIFSALAILAGLYSNPSFAQQKTYWWNDAVFYEIFVRSFYDGNGNGVGDLKGLIQKLDYLNDGDPATVSDLGITGIWLMPISESPSYHGYDVINYSTIERDYGTINDFQAFIAGAHARGIRVIVDFVMNHSSNLHPWFISSASSPSSPYRNWYIWSNQDPGYRGPWGQQVWHLRNGAYYFGLFWSGMPDLNYANQDVKNEMFKIARFWLDSLKVDGFRLDAIKHLFEAGPVMENVPATLNFLQEFRQFYKNVNANAMTVGEVWSGTSEIAPYSDGTKVDFCFDFPLSSAIINAVNTRQPRLIHDQILASIRSYPFLQYAPFLANHDQDRVFGQFGQDLNKMKLAAAIYLTLPGVPFIYYGEEIAMTGSGRDENKRTPMQWTGGANAGFSTGPPWYAINSNYVNFNVQNLQADTTSLWHWYRKLISIRNGYEALRRGDYAGLSANSSSLLAYARRAGREAVIVLHNFQNQTLSMPSLTLSESGLLAGAHTVDDLLSGQKLGTVLIENDGGFTAWIPELNIPAQGTAIVRIDSAVVPVSAVSAHEIQPAQYKLAQNYPNPLQASAFGSGAASRAAGNSSTTISYTLPRAVQVQLTIFDVSGKEIETLVNTMQAPGEYKIRWLPDNLAAGVYFYRLQAWPFVATKKMMLIR